MKLQAPAVIALLLLSCPVHAQDADLAKKLSNPVADLISLPIESNYDFGIGPGDGTRWTTNIQPVIPVSLNPDWNVISRTIIPVIDQQGIAPGGLLDETGLGDVVQSFFFSPKDSKPFIFGIGPALLIPTATDDLPGAEKWGAGPTGVILKQNGPWTFGALANHLRDYAGDDTRSSINFTYLQPFVFYTTPKATPFGLNVESTYDWQGNSSPVNATASQLMNFGDQPASLVAGVRSYAEAPDGGPEWGLRLGLTFLFPKSGSQCVHT